MATNNDIGLAEPSTITHKLATITQNWNSTVRHQELQSIAGGESTLEIMRVQATAPASTAMGAVVRLASGPSSAADVTIRVNQGIGNSTVGDIWNVNVRSSAANALFTAYQSTAADFQATVTPVAGSTWRTQPGSTLWASSAGFHFDSSGALQVTGATASTVVTVARMVGNSSAGDYMPVRVVDSSGTGFLTPGLEYTDGSTTSTLAAPGLAYRNSSNDTMRLVGMTTPLPVQFVNVSPTIQSTTILVNMQTAGGSTTLVSSVAAQSHKVFAFSVTSTVVFSSCTFISSASNERWGLLVGSGSSGVTGANLAVTPPGWLFKSVAGEALGFSASSTGGYRISISYFTEA